MSKRSDFVVEIYASNSDDVDAIWVELGENDTKTVTMEDAVRVWCQRNNQTFPECD